jgi:hypothetical protein
MPAAMTVVQPCHGDPPDPSIPATFTSYSSAEMLPAAGTGRMSGLSNIQVAHFGWDAITATAGRHDSRARWPSRRRCCIRLSPAAITSRRLSPEPGQSPSAKQPCLHCALSATCSRFTSTNRSSTVELHHQTPVRRPCRQACGRLAQIVPSGSHLRAG